FLPSHASQKINPSFRHFLDIVSRAVAAIGHQLSRYLLQLVFHALHRGQQLCAVVGLLRHRRAYDQSVRRVGGNLVLTRAWLLAFSPLLPSCSFCNSCNALSSRSCCSCRARACACSAFVRPCSLCGSPISVTRCRARARCSRIAPSP